MLKTIKNDAVVCNIGHFDNEIDTAFMRETWKFEEVKPQVHKVYRSADQNKTDFVFLLSEGRLVNLGNAAGYPSRITCSQPHWWSGYARENRGTIALECSTGYYAEVGADLRSLTIF
jgi:hypothetical protein